MKKRIEMKVHSRWLVDVAIDCSESAYWRKKLFDAEFNEAFPIDRNHLDGIFPDVSKAIRRHNMSFMAAKVMDEETESWLSDDGYVIFKFWTVKYPEMQVMTGNNPDEA